MLASSSTTRTRGRAVAGRGRAGGRRVGRGARAAARPLAVEPGVDVALAEAPLAADPDRRNLARLDQAVDRPKVDLEVLQDFFGGQKRFVNHRSASSSTLAGRRSHRQFHREDRRRRRDGWRRRSARRAPARCRRRSPGPDRCPCRPPWSCRTARKCASARRAGYPPPVSRTVATMRSPARRRPS